MFLQIAHGAGFTRKRLAFIWGCSETTVSNKCQNEENITLGELRAMIRVDGYEPTIGDCYELITGKRMSARELFNMKV